MNKIFRGTPFKDETSQKEFFKKLSEIIAQTPIIKRDFWEAEKKAGIFDWLEDNGIVYNPTFDYEMLKKNRERIYDEFERQLREEGQRERVNITESAILYFRLWWLDNELNILKNWMSNFALSNLSISQIKLYQEYVDSEIESLAPAPDIEKFEIQLRERGFFELILVNDLFHDKQKNLIKLIHDGGNPFYENGEPKKRRDKVAYQIAMFEYLGFIKNFHTSTNKVALVLKSILHYDNSYIEADIRSMKISNDQKAKAYLYKDIVKDDYNRLKKGAWRY